MKNLDSLIDAINSKNDFLFFLKKFISDYKKYPETWENKTIDAYLEGIEGWVEDIEGYYKNNNLDHVNLSKVNWRVFADILVAGSVYE